MIWKDGVYEYLMCDDKYQSVIVIVDGVGYLPGWEMPVRLETEPPIAIGKLLIELT